MQDTTFTSLKTEFNSSVATLQRIDESLRGCANASFNKEYYKWFNYLQIIKREAIVKMKDKEKVECNKLFNNLTNTFSVYNVSEGDKNKIEINLFNQLDSCEIFLRDFMNIKGMLMHDKDDYRGL